MVCSFYRLSLSYTTTIVFLAYVSTEDNNDIVNIKATTCNCVVVAHLTKLAISIFLGKIERNLGSSTNVFTHNFFQENTTIMLFVVGFR